jgi:hypothetical protein
VNGLQAAINGAVVAAGPLPTGTTVSIPRVLITGSGISLTAALCTFG